MLETVLEILSPSFLLREALYTSVAIGFLAPLVGVYLILRRMIFVGVTLPQVSAAGIAAVFFLYGIFDLGHTSLQTGEYTLALIGSLIVTPCVLVFLAQSEKSDLYSSEARVGVVFAIASALTVLLLAFDPHGEAQMVNILKGDMLAATKGSFLSFLAVGLLVSGVLVFFRRQLLLVSFDRELANVFRMRVALWDLILYLAIGAMVSVGVMCAGPLVMFGTLILPPLIARALTDRMSQFFVFSSLIGGFSSVVSFILAYLLDLPLGPVCVAFLGVLLVGLNLLRGVWGIVVNSPRHSTLQ